MPVAVYCKPEQLFGYDYVTSAYSESPQTSAQRIIEHMAEIYPVATDKQLKKMLG
jgi:hypothetical protein